MSTASTTLAPGLGDAATPIFVGGCSRSGTTLLGSMLGGSPTVVCIPEAQFFQPYYAMEESPGRGVCEWFPDTLQDWRLRAWGLPNEEIRRIGGDTVAPAELIRRLVGSYARTRAKRHGYSHWVDHTPSSLQHFRSIRRHFPSARFVHLVRDGRGVAASMLPLEWGANTVSEAARYWLQQLAFGLMAEVSLNAETIARVRYEDLLRDPDGTLRSLCTTLGLTFDEGMLATTGFEVPTYSSAQHGLVGSGVQSSRAEAWTKALTSRQVALFEFVAGDMLDSLGYTRVHPQGTRAPSSVEKAREAATEIVRKVVNRHRYQRKRQA